MKVCHTWHEVIKSQQKTLENVRVSIVEFKSF